MACHLVAACVPRLAVVSSSASRGSPPRRVAPRPSGGEVRRAIGAADDPSASGRDKQSGFMELLASTPIGQPESDAERRIREAAEWVVDNTEARAQEVAIMRYVYIAICNHDFYHFCFEKLYEQRILEKKKVIDIVHTIEVACFVRSSIQKHQLSKKNK
uniref:Uncharacterized protein n=1 Tax=Aegilops tauschii TaxID=37682 RepID=M8BD71_AEGTA